MFENCVGLPEGRSWAGVVRQRHHNCVKRLLILHRSGREALGIHQSVPQWQIRTEVVLLKEMEKKNARIQTLEKAVRGPLLPKIDWVNKRGE